MRSVEQGRENNADGEQRYYDGIKQMHRWNGTRRVEAVKVERGGSVQIGGREEIISCQTNLMFDVCR